jgi:hypothetical protein
MDSQLSRRYEASKLQAPPVQPWLPSGMFIDIDQKYYSPQPKILNEHEGFARQGKAIVPYMINYGSGPPAVSVLAPMGGTNYGSYLYNPRPEQIGGGTDAHHLNFS